MSGAGGGAGWSTRPERLYVITGGRSRPSRNVFDLVTLVVADARPTTGTPPEQAAILTLCRHPLSVAEIAAQLELPVSVTTILLEDLLEQRHIAVRPPVPAAALPDIGLLEAVIHGLRKIS